MIDGIIIVIPGASKGDAALSAAGGGGAISVGGAGDGGWKATPGGAGGDSSGAESVGAGVATGLTGVAGSFAAAFAFVWATWSVSAAQAASLKILAGGLGGSGVDFEIGFSLGAAAAAEARGLTAAPGAANENAVTQRKTAAKPVKSQRSREIPRTSSGIG
jgi:hypothetical protein